MSYLQTAKEGYDGRYGIFNPPHVETATKQELWTEYRSISQMKPNEVIEFNIPNSSLYYIDLSRTKLMIKARILREDGSTVNFNDDKVCLVNNALHSAWRQVDISLNQTMVGSDVGSNYPYKAILDTLLYRSSQDLNSSAQAQLFYKDESGFMDSTDIKVSNPGAFWRFDPTSKGGSAMMEGVLCLDVMSIKQFIPNGVGINVKLYPARNEFCLFTGQSERYKLDIHDASLRVQYIEPSNNLLIGHAEALNKSPALFPYIKSTLKTFTIPQAVQTWSIDTLFANEIPDTLIVAMVDSEAFNGKYSLNPFNFKHFNLTNLTFYIEGRPQNTASFTPDFDNQCYTSEYLALFENRSNEEKEGGDIIGFSDFCNGYSIFKINIARGLQRNFTSLAHRGQTRLKFTFKAPLEKSVQVICYGRMSSILQIDKTKNVIAY